MYCINKNKTKNGPIWDYSAVLPSQVTSRAGQYDLYLFASGATMLIPWDLINLRPYKNNRLMSIR